MTKTRIAIASLLFVLVGAMAIKSMRPRTEPPISVQVGTVVRAEVTRLVTGAGKLEPIHKVNVSSNITGVLLELKVEIGSRVNVGDVLCQIDTSRYRAQVAQQAAQVQSAAADMARANANLDFLRSEVVRIEAAFQQGVTPISELTRAKSSLALAEAEAAGSLGRSSGSRASLAEAKNALGWATIRAPISGTVLAINHRVGERVRGSDFSEDVILTIGSLTDVEVRLEVSEQDVVFIKPGQAATLDVDAFPGQPMKGRVKESGRDALVRNQGTENEITTFPVWVTLLDPPERVLSGMSAQVTIATETRPQAIAVPIAAVTVRAPDAGQAPQPSKSSNEPVPANAPLAVNPLPSAGKTLDKVVFVVKDGVAQKRNVTVGLSSETMVEIKEGLAENEQIVTGPYRVLARELTDGQAVAPEDARD